MNTVEKITMEAANQSRHPEPSVGDTIKVHYKIKEGGKERVQLYTGTVIARKGKGLMESITVRRISYGEGVERIFPLNSLTLKRSKLIVAVKYVVPSCIISGDSQVRKRVFKSVAKNNAKC